MIMSAMKEFLKTMKKGIHIPKKKEGSGFRQKKKKLTRIEKEVCTFPPPGDESWISEYGCWVDLEKELMMSAQQERDRYLLNTSPNRQPYFGVPITDSQWLTNTYNVYYDPIEECPPDCVCEPSTPSLTYKEVLTNNGIIKHYFIEGTKSTEQEFNDTIEEYSIDREDIIVVHEVSPDYVSPDEEKYGYT